MSTRARRRGGRGRRRTPHAAPPPRPTFWQKVLAFFGAKRKSSAGRLKRGPDAADVQESRVFREFSNQFGIPFKDIALLKLALTHRSYLSVTGQSARESNERLEFLGDSVLGLVTSEFLYRRHPDEHEGHLTKVKSLLVSKAILSRRALKMGLGRYVLMSRSEVESGGRQRLSIIADAFESVLGAIYLDQGFEVARRFIHEHLLTDADDIVADKRHTNYKSHLQEYVQSTYRTHPVYRIRSEYGPDHSKYFMVEVMVGRRMLGEGRGHNKKEAEQAAARDAIERVTELRRGASEGRRDEHDPVEEREPEDLDDSPPSPSEEDEHESGDDSRGSRRRRGGRGRSRRERGSERHGSGAGRGDEEAECELELAEEAEARGEVPVEPSAREDDEHEPVARPDDPDAELDEPVEGFVARRRPEAEEPAIMALPARSFGRGRRAGRTAAPTQAPEPSAAEEERHVDPFALAEVAAEAASEPAEPAERDADKEALIDEMERAMENFGRRSSSTRRRRSR